VLSIHVYFLIIADGVPSLSCANVAATSNGNTKVASANTWEI
jgi:hypothetical protein